MVLLLVRERFILKLLLWCFNQGLALHGNVWKHVAAFVRTRTLIQTRTHAQKYFMKISKDETKRNKVCILIIILIYFIYTVLPSVFRFHFLYSYHRLFKGGMSTALLPESQWLVDENEAKKSKKDVACDATPSSSFVEHKPTQREVKVKSAFRAQTILRENEPTLHLRYGFGDHWSKSRFSLTEQTATNVSNAAAAGLSIGHRRSTLLTSAVELTQELGHATCEQMPADYTNRAQFPGFSMESHQTECLRLSIKISTNGVDSRCESGDELSEERVGWVWNDEQPDGYDDI